MLIKIKTVLILSIFFILSDLNASRAAASSRITLDKYGRKQVTSMPLDITGLNVDCQRVILEYLEDKWEEVDLPIDRKSNILRVVEQLRFSQDEKRLTAKCLKFFVHQDLCRLIRYKHNGALIPKLALLNTEEYILYLKTPASLREITQNITKRSARYTTYTRPTHSSNGHYYFQIINGCEIRLLNASNDLLFIKKTGRPSYFIDCAFSPNNEFFMALTNDGLIIKWDISSEAAAKKAPVSFQRAKLPENSSNHPPYKLAISPDNKYIAVGFVTKLETEQNHHFLIKSSVVIADFNTGKTLYVLNNEQRFPLFAWPQELTDEEKSELSEKDRIDFNATFVREMFEFSPLVFSPSGKYLAYGTDLATVKLWVNPILELSRPVSTITYSDQEMRAGLLKETDSSFQKELDAALALSILAATESDQRNKRKQPADFVSTAAAASAAGVNKKAQATPVNVNMVAEYPKLSVVILNQSGKIFAHVWESAGSNFEKQSALLAVLAYLSRESDTDKIINVLADLEKFLSAHIKEITEIKKNIEIRINNLRKKINLKTDFKFE